MSTRELLVKKYGDSKEVPWFLVQPVMAAIGEGATLGQAMLAGGMTIEDWRAWNELSARGHRVWVYVVGEIRVMQYRATRGATRRRKALAEAGDSTMGETTQYLERVLPEEYGPGVGAGTPGAGAPGVVINILKQFEPSPALPATARVVDVTPVAALGAGDE